MSDFEQRIRFEVARVVTNNTSWPAAMARQILGRDLSKPIGMITDALAPVIAEAQAAALREAAEALARLQRYPGSPTAGPATALRNETITEAETWLRARADQAEGQ